MAFNHPALQNIGPQGGPAPRLWSYNAGDDNRAAVVASGYFNDAWRDLKVRDVIFVAADDHPVILAVAGITGAGVVTTERLDAVT
jgi:hypothetical protein